MNAGLDNGHTHQPTSNPLDYGVTSAEGVASLRPSAASRPLRVALYSHDTMGLGHIRRNLLIAQTLSGSHLRPNTLLLSGTLEGGHFLMPPGVDCIVLPALHKGRHGSYRSRRFDIPLPEFVALRRATAEAALRAFDPDVLIVDNVPWGAANELDAALEGLRRQGRCHCVLGLRGILDDPEVVRREWYEKRNEHAINTYFDEIWVYGDPAVYDTAREYRLPSDIATKIRYTGYLDQRARTVFAGSKAEAALQLPERDFVLCAVGGGQDGVQLARAFIQSEMPPGVAGILLTGPHMAGGVVHHLQRQAARRGRLRVIEFHPEPTVLLAQADCVIAMGGYNTVSEILSFKKRALVVPRVAPRREQLIRAQRLRDLGFLEMLHPDQLGPETLSRWLHRNVGKPPRRFRNPIDMSGLERLPAMLEELLRAAPMGRRTPSEVTLS